MPNNKTVRRDYIDIMKGLGILLVVLGHFMEQFRFNFKPIGATFICIYLFHMALFCICSGLRDYADPKLLKPGRPAFVALGDNALRVELLQKLAAAGYDTPVFISDMAAGSPSAVLEPGCVILPQAYVGAGARLGVGCIVNGGAIVDHDATLGRGVHIAPGGIVKAGAEVEAMAKVDSGEVIRK